MAVLNPNNWHWVDKNTLPWSQSYFKEKFTNFELESPSKKEREDDDVYKYRVVQVKSVTGDSNVSQRKGKPICYFDLNLEFTVSVIRKRQQQQEEEEGEETDCETEDEGSLVLPEFMHDETDLEFIVTGFKNQSSEDLVRREFLGRLKEELLQYQNDLLRTHAPDLQG